MSWPKKIRHYSFSSGVCLSCRKIERMRDTSLLFFVPLGLKSQLRQTRSQSWPGVEESSRSDTNASSSVLKWQLKQYCEWRCFADCSILYFFCLPYKNIFYDRKQHTYCLFVFFLTVRPVSRTSHWVPFWLFRAIPVFHPFHHRPFCREELPFPPSIFYNKNVK